MDEIELLNWGRNLQGGERGDFSAPRGSERDRLEWLSAYNDYQTMNGISAENLPRFQALVDELAPTRKEVAASMKSFKNSNAGIISGLDIPNLPRVGVYVAALLFVMLISD